MGDLEEATRLIAKNVNIEAISGTLQSELQNLKKAADDGEYSWTMASVLAGGLLCVSGFFGVASSVVYLSPFSFVLNLYIMAFGAIFVILEYKQKFLTKQYLSMLRSEALFLTRPYGRALFYIFVGVLVVCSGGLLNLLIGETTYMMFAILLYSTHYSYRRSLYHYGWCFCVLLIQANL